MTRPPDLIESTRPAGEWAEGYPIGNGRLGGMVLGNPQSERIALNHDRLWRNFWQYQKHTTAEDLPKLRQLMSAGRYDEAHELLLRKIPVSSHAIYLNPFVPLGDLGVYPVHDTTEVGGYQRCLDLDSGVVTVRYQCGEVAYRRQYFVSWPHQVMVIRLTASQAGAISGQFTLSRLLDPDCEVTGRSSLGEVVLEGQFEEGVHFAAVTRVIQRGGRLTGGRNAYTPLPGNMPPKDLRGLQFIFRENTPIPQSCGVSTCVDRADEVLLLVKMAVDDETHSDLVDWCRACIDNVPAEFSELHRMHVEDHRRVYRRVQLGLGPDDATPLATQIEQTRATGKADPGLSVRMFNLGRYLAIASGRPTPDGLPAKAPINLQGLWNQDRRPPWDCDYHLDLNLEMCYWPLHAANLGEWLQPLAAWVRHLMPQARFAAQDLFGCRGVYFSGVCDLRHLGNVDDLGFGWTGAGAWLAQILWQHWEYSGDRVFLSQTLHPLLGELADFFEDYLTETDDGWLVPIPSASPEMGIYGRKRYSALSSPSTIDLELIREVFEHAAEAGALLDVEDPRIETWRSILGRLPAPPINHDGCLQEWLEDHPPIDPHHRHRSPFVGLCPGDRITPEDTPRDLEAARKLLAERQSNLSTTCAMTCSWDGQLLARMYDGDAALQMLNLICGTWLVDNGLLSICDWRENSKSLNWFPGRKVFQVEASIGVVGLITDMLLQDRRQLLRLLPALPQAWPEGKVSGLRAKGGFEVDLKWEAHRLVEARIHSLRGGSCRVRCYSPKTPLKLISHPHAEVAPDDDAVLAFSTSAGETYVVRPLAG